MQSQMVVLLLAAATLMPDPQNPRKVVDCEDLRLELRLLGQDMKQRGVLVPLLVRRNGDVYVVIDGHRRLAAALLVSIDKLPCIVVEGNVTPEQALEIALVTSLHKQDLSASEKVHAFLSLKKLNQGVTVRELVARLHISESLASRYQCYEKCIRDAQCAFDQAKIGLKALYTISQQEAEQQQRELLDMAVAGCSSEKLERQGKKARIGDKPVVRMSKLRLARPGGRMVTISGQALSLDDVIEELTQLIKELKDASREHLDARTVEKICRDKAKGG